MIFDYSMAEWMIHLNTYGGKTSGWRCAILLFLSFRLNEQNRTWVELETIADKVGCGLTTASQIMNEFEAMQAVRVIPREEWNDYQKKKFHPAKKIWELTGVCKIGETIYSYAYTHSKTILSENESLNFHNPKLSESEGKIKQDIKEEIKEDEIQAKNILPSSFSPYTDDNWLSISIPELIEHCKEQNTMEWFCVFHSGKETKQPLKASPEWNKTQCTAFRMGKTKASKCIVAFVDNHVFLFGDVKLWMCYAGFGMKWTMEESQKQLCRDDFDSRWNGNNLKALKVYPVSFLMEMKKKKEKVKQQFPFRTATALLNFLQQEATASTPTPEPTKQMVVLSNGVERIQVYEDDPRLKELIERGFERE